MYFYHICQHGKLCLFEETGMEWATYEVVATINPILQIRKQNDWGWWLVQAFWACLLIQCSVQRSFYYIPLMARLHRVSAAAHGDLLQSSQITKVGRKHVCTSMCGVLVGVLEWGWEDKSSIYLLRAEDSFLSWVLLLQPLIINFRDRVGVLLNQLCVWHVESTH